MMPLRMLLFLGSLTAASLVWLGLTSDAPAPPARQDEDCCTSLPAGAGTLKIGDSVPEVTLRDLRGGGTTTSALAGSVFVLAFNGVDCPISKLYAGRLRDLHGRYAARGVRFYGVNSNFADSVEDLRDFVRDYRITFPMVRDEGNIVADALGAKQTTDVFVFDAKGKLRFRGAVDDQYTLKEGQATGRGKARPEKNWLIDALDALLAGRDVAVPETAAPGCEIGRVTVAPEDAEITFYRDIEPIIQESCQDCHREGEVAPSSFMTYEDVAGSARMIARVVRRGRMPPWHANPEHGVFENDRSLSPEAKEKLLSWVSLGAPAGDPRHRPAPRSFEHGWRIGKPDLIMTMDEPFAVPAEGQVDYHHVLLDPKFEEDAWVQGVEIRPGDREVVHHIMAFVIPPDADDLEMAKELEGGKHGYFALMVPGEEPTVYPEDMAKLVPAGSKILMTIHYQPNGRPTTDRSSMGLVLAKKPARYPLFTEAVYQDKVVINPNTKMNMTAAYVLDKETAVVSYTPHMHYRGRSFVLRAYYPASVELKEPLDLTALPPELRPLLRYEEGSRTLGFLGAMSPPICAILQRTARNAGDREAIDRLRQSIKWETLLDVPTYDFGWQNTYRLAEPKVLPKGTLLLAVGHFDNTTDNPYLTAEMAAQVVRWGLQSTDEMMLGYYDYFYRDGTRTPQRVREAQKPK